MRLGISLVALSLLAFTYGVAMAVEPGSSSEVEASLPTFRRQTVFYSLAGKSLVELVAEHRALALKQEAPERLGYTAWNATLNTTHGFGAKTSCSVEPITFVVTVTTTLPRAVNSGQFSPDDSLQWHTFLPGLKRHEARHDSIIVSETSAFLRQVESEANGAMQTKDISQCVDELRTRIDRANARLDEVTQHGRTEGAILVLPSRP